MSQADLFANLLYITEWLKSSNDPKMKNLLRCAEDIKKLSDLFKPQV